MTLRIPDHIVWQDIPGDLALFDTATASYHALNGSAAAIWRALASGQGAHEVCDTLAAAYDAPRDAVARDVDAFIADAQAKGLLVRQTA